MKAVLTLCFIAGTVQALAPYRDITFAAGAMPECRLDASGRTVVSYQAGNPSHQHFKCEHQATGGCTCVPHPTHAAGNCKEVIHTDTSHVWKSGDCEDQCEGVTCSGNGTCQDGENTYTCNCNSGWTGQQCETSLNTCQYKHVHPGCDSRTGHCSNPSACVNGCMAHYGGCTPNSKFSVKRNNCQRKCSSNPCKHAC